MAGPARRSPAGLDAAGCADIRQLIAVTLKAVPAAYAGWLASGCDSTSPAADMLDLILGLIQHLDDAVRNVDVGQGVIDERCARAVEQDRAGHPRRRGYPLRAV